MTDAPETIWAVTEPNDVSADILGEVYAQQTPEGMVGTPIKYRRADLPPKVRALEWTVFDAWTMWVETPIGKWSIDDIGKDGEEGCVLLKKNGQSIRYFDEDGNDWGMWPSIEDAKSAAQADFSARILSALEV